MAPLANLCFSRCGHRSDAGARVLRATAASGAPAVCLEGVRGVPMAYLGPEDSAALAAAAPALRARRGALHKAAVDLCARQTGGLHE